MLNIQFKSFVMGALFVLFVWPLVMRIIAKVRS